MRMNVKDLNDKLQELKVQKMKDEMQARRFLGDLQIPMTSKKQAKVKGDTFNLKRTRRMIAFIETLLADEKR